MVEEAGKLEVEFVVISDAAVRRLERLEKQFGKVETATEKHGAVMKKAFKQMSIATAAFGAVMTGVLYGIIRSSSYASMWMDSLKYSTMRLSDKILEMTGLDDHIDDLLRSYENFLDTWEEEGLKAAFDVTLTDFTDWWDDLSVTEQRIYAVIGVVALLVFGLAVLAIGLKAAGIVTGVVSGLLLLMAGGGLVAVLSAALLGIAIGVLIGLIAQWVLTKAGVYDWFAEIGKGYKAWEHWSKDLAEVIALPVLMFLAALHDLTTLDFKFTMTKQMKKEMDDALGRTKERLGMGTYNDGESIGIGDSAEQQKFDKNISDAQKHADKMYDIYNIAGTANMSAYSDGYETSYAEHLDLLDSIATTEDIEAVNKLIKSWEAGAGVSSNYADGAWSGMPAITNYNQGVNDIQFDAYDMQERHAYVHGVNTSKNIADGMMDALPGIVDALDNMVHRFTVFVSAVNAAMDKLVQSYTITVKTIHVSGSWSGGGGGSGGGTTPKNEREGDWGSAATGAHVLRSGVAMVHQGEDIINLNKMMSGARFDKNTQKDITINNTINITSGNLSNPMEVGRVADTISKRMGEELRRISTSI